MFLDWLIHQQQILKPAQNTIMWCIIYSWRWISITVIIDVSLIFSFTHKHLTNMLTSASFTNCCFKSDRRHFSVWGCVAVDTSLDLRTPDCSWLTTEWKPWWSATLTSQHTEQLLIGRGSNTCSPPLSFQLFRRQAACVLHKHRRHMSPGSIAVCVIYLVSLTSCRMI